MREEKKKSIAALNYLVLPTGLTVLLVCLVGARHPTEETNFDPFSLLNVAFPSIFTWCMMICSGDHSVAPLRFDFAQSCVVVEYKSLLNEH